MCRCKDSNPASPTLVLTKPMRLIPIDAHHQRHSTPAALGVMAWLRFWGYTASLMLGADLIKKKTEKNS